MTKRRLDRKPDVLDGKQKVYHELAKISPAYTFPTQVNLTRFASPVRNQGDLGSCTSFAGSGNVEYLENMEIAQGLYGANAPEVFIQGQFNPISTLYLYYNERTIDGDVSQDAGSSLYTCTRAVATYGVCRENLWAYVDTNMAVKPPVTAYAEGAKHKVLIAYQITSLDQMKHCLVNGYPFILGITVYDSFMSAQVAQTGNVPIPGVYESPIGGHALCCMGYDDARQALLIRNSWGTSWGLGGYCWIPYAYMTNPNLASDFWTLRRTP